MAFSSMLESSLTPFQDVDSAVALSFHLHLLLLELLLSLFCPREALNFFKPIFEARLYRRTTTPESGSSPKKATTIHWLTSTPPAGKGTN